MSRRRCALRIYFFFVDIYIHRKTLAIDPFVSMIQNEPDDIRDCVTLRMSWIDEEINQHTTPSAQAIYDKYIKPFANMEVNIPGQIKKKIMNVFEESKPIRTFRERVQLELINVRSSVLGRVSIRQSRSSFKIASIQESVKNEARQSWQTLSMAELSSGRGLIGGIPEEPSIIHFYPAWKSLVNLLKSDTLIRFRNMLAKKRNALN